MPDPFVLLVGYEMNGEPSVTLDAETYASDNSGGGMYDIFAVAEILNSGKPVEVILPWMNRRRLRLTVSGKWVVEGIEDVARDLPGKLATARAIGADAFPGKWVPAFRAVTPAE